MFGSACDEFEEFGISRGWFGKVFFVLLRKFDFVIVNQLAFCLSNQLHIVRVELLGLIT